MSTSTPEIQITTELVCQAARGVNIENDRQLLIATHGGKIPPECRDAITIVLGNPAGFERWFQSWLSEHPRMREMFGEILTIRLTQDGILQCPIFRAICDDSQNLERRLERVRCMPGVEEIKKEYHAGGNSNATDLVILNLTTEILVMDLLMQLGFNVQRTSKQEQAHIDITAQRGGKLYAVEVIRKKEIESWKALDHWGIGIGLEDCASLDNHKKIRNLLKRTLKDKNHQFTESLHAKTISSSMVKVVAIRTDDAGITECIAQVELIARGLLQKPNLYRNIDCVWLIPQSGVAQSRWVCRNAIGLVSE
jgi:hypothetical protein